LSETADLPVIIYDSEHYIADGRLPTVVASSESLPSAEGEDEGPEQELMDENMKDRRVNELWMDFDVLCKCFRSDSY